MRLLAHDADVEGVFVEEEPDVRALAGGPAGNRLALDQRANRRGRGPIRFVEETVQADRSG